MKKVYRLAISTIIIFSFGADTSYSMLKAGGPGHDKDDQTKKVLKKAPLSAYDATKTEASTQAVAPSNVATKTATPVKTTPKKRAKSKKVSHTSKGASKKVSKSKATKSAHGGSIKKSLKAIKADLPRKGSRRVTRGINHNVKRSSHKFTIDLWDLLDNTYN